MRVSVVRDGAWNQWIVKVWDDYNNRMQAWDYYTNSKEDAKATAECMLRDNNPNSRAVRKVT